MALAAALLTVAANPVRSAETAATATVNTEAGASPGSLTGTVGSAPTTGATESGPSVAQGALAIDLGNVRRVRVAGVIIPETPMRVGNLDILAPIVGDNSELLQRLGASATRAAAENLPGNINTPTQDQSFQINLPQGAPLVLTVGRSVGYIDNVEQQLRAAPLVINGKIWLPIFSIAPLIGASARLQPDGTLQVNPTVQSVELFPVKGYTVLTVKVSAPLKAGDVLMGTTENPPKLYLDFRGYSMGFDAAYSSNERTVSAGVGDVQRARAGMFQSFPDTTRVVLDLKQELTGVAQPLPDKTLFALVVVRPGGKSPEPSMTETQQTSIINPAPARDGSLRGLTIVVDAGHGGHDSGAPGKKGLEKHHALDIARRLRNNLEARGATVLMTRDGDYFISLQNRVDYANSRNADLFFSVHINSFKSTSTGTSTHFYTSQSAAFSREVQNELVKATGLKSRGSVQSRFYVVRNTRMPSILTETCFISNPNEEA
ncbi:MAG TPA: N-acetylmuramoyl-L-alanine amidase, partial [Abditibacteriaceae bacterium]